MKMLFSFILLSIVICNQQTYCQANKNSIIVWSVRIMQSQLQLSDRQTTGVLDLITKQSSSADSLGQNTFLKVEDRGKELEKMQAKYEKPLKDLLSNDQWKRYKAVEAERIAMSRGPG